MNTQKLRKISLALSLAISFSLTAAKPNITGTVTADGKPLAGVLVSDGDKIVKTDKKGRYAINSRKKDGTVFVITPSGYYAPSTDNFQPAFWSLLDKDVRKKENHDFSLTAQNQDRFTLLFPTDIHIVNDYERDDINKFKRMALPAMQEIAAGYRAQGPLYSVNLGDTSHDIFWYDNDMDLVKVIKFLADNNFPGPVYSVSGNHDNDGSIIGDNVDERAAWQYRQVLGPGAYSFNIGNTHWVMLDNVIYKNIPTAKMKKAKGIRGDRSYDRGFTPEQLEWMRRDIALVPDSMQVFIGCHVPIIYNRGEHKTLLNDPAQLAILDDIYKRFDNVIVVSGHSHLNTYMRSEEYPRFEQYVFVATSGCIWNTQPGSQILGGDGSAGGVWAGEFVKGQKPVIRFRPYEDGNDYFRAYDVNEVGRYYNHDYVIDFQRKIYPNRPDFGKEEHRNEILVNFWGDVAGNKLEILENGKPLKVVKRTDLEDPLYNISRCAPAAVKTQKFDKGENTRENSHLYVARAQTAVDPVEIRVVSPEGKVLYSETMIRPKDFDRKAK